MGLVSKFRGATNGGPVSIGTDELSAPNQPDATIIRMIVRRGRRVR